MRGFGYVVLLCLVMGMGVRAEGEESAEMKEVERWGEECQKYYAAGRYTEGGLLCKKAVDALERLAPESLPLAEALNDLAMFVKEQREFANAELLLLRSLRIKEKTLGTEHLSIARALNNLSQVYQAEGAYEKAEQFIVRSLKLKEKLIGKEDPSYATSLNNLASVYQSQRKYEEAETTFLDCVKLREKILGFEHPDLGTTLENLASVYKDQELLDKAEPLYLRSLRIKEKTLGPEHLDIADIFNSLGYLNRRRGNYAEAESLYLKGMQIREKISGLEHPVLVSSLFNLAMLYIVQGQPARAVPFFSRALALQNRVLSRSVTDKRVSSQLDAMRRNEDAVYRLPLRLDATPATRSLALTTSLVRRGLSMEAALITGRALWDNLTTESQRQRFTAWQNLRVQRETLFLRGPGKQLLEVQQTRLSDLQNQIDSLELELAHDAMGPLRWKPSDPEQILPRVAERLPSDGALIEMILVKPDPLQVTKRNPLYDSPRYTALLLFPDQKIEFIDLGLAEEIDQSAAEFLLAARDPARDPIPSAQALYKKIFAPLIPKLHDAKTLLLSLDGSLNLVPFDALHDGKQYLVDSPYKLVYVSSGRDLLRGTLGPAKQRPLVIADPDFGKGGALFATAQTREIDSKTRGLYEGVSDVARLPGTRQEGLRVSKLLGVRPLFDAQASEDAVRKARAPLVLHIATHGFLLDEPSKGEGRSLVTPVPPKKEASIDPVLGRSKEHSLANGALVLAGATQAARAPDASQDGLLTAEEARSLNLFGTQLVVLSACDTGRGTVKAGQGVYGLRRAFLVAGAETVVMSLWPVSDPGTGGLMERYYGLLLDKKRPRGRVSGLREAMQGVKRVHAHPYYWAPFIALGKDAPLEGVSRR